MNGQFLMNRAIAVQYAFKKDGKGERHGTPAERLLAAQARKNNALPSATGANLPAPPPSAPNPMYHGGGGQGGGHHNPAMSYHKPPGPTHHGACPGPPHRQSQWATDLHHQPLSNNPLRGTSPLLPPVSRPITTATDPSRPLKFPLLPRTSHLEPLHRILSLILLLKLNHLWEFLKPISLSLPLLPVSPLDNPIFCFQFIPMI
ncbi:hypothetical protein PTTG_06909, partial [Puccinia triticina 1-1 BBBD Race 1]